MDSYEKVIAVVKKYTGQNTKYNIKTKKKRTIKNCAFLNKFKCLPKLLF